MHGKGGFIYLITNKNLTTLYTGVTSDLVSRIIQHREKHFPRSFSSRYNLKKLIHFEVIDSIEGAIEREKYIKGKSRKWELDLINNSNPDWKDRWDEIKNW